MSALGYILVYKAGPGTDGNKMDHPIPLRQFTAVLSSGLRTHMLVVGKMFVG